MTFHRGDFVTYQGERWTVYTTEDACGAVDLCRTEDYAKPLGARVNGVAASVLTLIRTAPSRTIGKGADIDYIEREDRNDGEVWMAYLIDTFLKPGATVAGERANPVPGRTYPEGLEHFTFDHEVNGVIDAQGDDPEDRWRLHVTANVVTVQKAQIVWDSEG